MTASEVRGFFRDWRFRTVLPIFLIHLIAFLGFFWLIYRLAFREAVEGHRSGATMVLHEVDAAFRSSSESHETISDRSSLLQHEEESHGGIQLALFDAAGAHVQGNGHGPVSPETVARVNRALGDAGYSTSWSLLDGRRAFLVGVQVFRNEWACRRCHGTESRNLGAIELRLDITNTLTATRRHLRLYLSLLILLWIGLVYGMIRFRDRVIGLPLARMQSSIPVLGNEKGTERPQDLDALAERFHDAIWGLIERQREREQSIAVQMARAEQLAALGQLAAGLTHEIKNPLAGIAAMLEVLRLEETRGGEKSVVYEQILQELSRVSGTVDGLLRLAKPQPPQRVDLNLERTVRDVAALFEAQVRKRQVRLSIAVEGSVPVLPLDPSMMNQLIVNLLTNSLDAVGDGGEISIRLGPFPRNDGVALVVSDTGYGIDPSDLERVFDSFYTTKEHGTGLGLSICRQIVEQHGGTIALESEKGKGTKVVILLPAPAAPEEGHEVS